MVEGHGPRTAADSPARNTRSFVRNLNASDWVQSPAGMKLHEQTGILISDDEECQSTDAVASDEDHEIVDGKRIRASIISATPVKRPRPTPPQPKHGYTSAK